MKIENKVMQPREYLESVTGEYIMTESDTKDEIEAILNDYGFSIWSYRLDEVVEAMNNANESDIVLVELCTENDATVHEWRWFEIKMS